MGRTLFLCALLCALLTLPTAWSTRRSISTDGLVYIDIANSARGMPAQSLLTNAYWSPAFPALIAAALSLTGARTDTELTVVHGLQWVIALGAYLSFGWFLFNLLRWVRSAHKTVFDSRIGFFAFLAFAYTLALANTIDPAAWGVYPDILVEGIVYAAAAICIRLSLPNAGMRHYAALGIILALGYAAKAALFPLSLALFGILFVWPIGRAFRWKGPAVAAASFLLLSSPLIAGLSHAKGRLTFGDAGRVNYAWLVNGVSRYAPFGFGLPRGAVLKHPPETIVDSPPIFRLGGPVKGTMPLWDDPSYWFEGIPSHFDFRRQTGVFLTNLGILRFTRLDGTPLSAIARSWIPLFAGLAALALAGLRVRKTYRAMATHIWLFLWPVAAILMFACVVFQPRYIIPFVVLEWTALIVTACIAVPPARSTPIILATVLGLFIWNGPGLVRSIRVPRKDVTLQPWEESAKELKSLGIRPGDELATAGSANIPACYYCVRLVGARFTFVVLGAPDVPADEVRSALETLRVHGARAILSADRPGFDHDPHWIALKGGTYVRLLQ